MVAHERPSRLSSSLHLLFCACRSKAVDYEAVAASGSPTKRLGIPPMTDSSPTTVSSAGSDVPVVEVVPLATEPPLPTRNIVTAPPDMSAVSFLTIEPLLMTVSTDPDGHYHDRRDDDLYESEEEDDISEVTGFRDYSLISM